MTSAAQPVTERSDARTIVLNGMILGTITAIGVTVFALGSRPMSGTAETIVQSVLVLAGGAVFSFFPAIQIQPRSIDSIAWAALVGLLGALTFTVLDTAVLRPMNLYHWTWDAIGGGSGWWYVSVWWMGSGMLAWWGAWVTANAAAKAGGTPNIPVLAVQTVFVAIVLFVLLGFTGIAPFTTSIMALAFSLGLFGRAVVGGLLGRG